MIDLSGENDLAKIHILKKSDLPDPSVLWAYLQTYHVTWSHGWSHGSNPLNVEAVSWNMSVSLFTDSNEIKT